MSQLIGPERLPEGRPRVLTSAWLNQTLDLLKQVAGLTVAPPLTMRRTGGQVVIGIRNPPTIDLIEITGPQDAAGWWPAVVKQIDTSSGTPVYVTLETTKVWIP